MNRRQFLETVTAGACLAATWQIAMGQPSTSARTNIILVMTDDQGWGDVGYMGHPILKTPNLDAMAAAGIRLDRFYAADAVCSPTRASVLTGRCPDRYHCRGWGCDLPLREVTVAEAVKTVGYATGHFGKWHLGGLPHADGGTGRGVPESFDPKPRHPGNQGFDEWYSNGNWFDINPEQMFHNGKDVGPVKGETSDLVMDKALEFIQKCAKSKKPFLAVIWFPSPHWPYKASEKYRAPYKDLTEADYYGEIAGVDQNIGRMRNQLRKLGIADNTLVWFNSDNGGSSSLEASNGGLSGGKGMLQEGGIRVPGIIEWPAGIKKPFITRIPTGTVDICPTLLDLLDIKKVSNQIEPIDGISIVPLIQGRWTCRPRPLMFNCGEGMAIVDNNYKLVKSKGGCRLYDLETDKEEKIDISSKHPETTARLQSALNAWWQSVVQDQKLYPST